MNTLVRRGITGFFYVCVMSLGMLLPFAFYVVLLSFIHFVVWREYISLSKLMNDKKEKGKMHNIYQYNLILLGQSVALFFIYQSPQITDRVHLQTVLFCILTVSFFLFCLLTLFSVERDRNIPIALLGLLWISVSIGLLLNLRTNVVYESIFVSLDIAPLYFFICIWITDTFAYLIGSTIGKNKISSLSPKKTWEGTIGGIIVAALSCGYVFSYIDWIRAPHAYILPVVISIFSVIGDLAESAMKRKAQVKDSGNILPGHGGLFDRLDSALAAIFAVAIYAYVVKMIS